MTRTGSSSRPKRGSDPGFRVAAFHRLRGSAIVVAFGLGVGSGMAEVLAQPGTGLAGRSAWLAADHRLALQTFRAGCREPAAPFRAACQAAGRVGLRTDGGARRFFERWFDPVAVDRDGKPGFLTGYFEPEFDASLVREGRFQTPLLAPPAGLVVLRPGIAAPRGWPAGLTAAIRTPSGFVPLPAREEIEAGALGPSARPVAFLADPVDAFALHVQGSGRLRLPDGRTVRVGFAGRNGHPYTAIARRIAEREGMPASSLTADRLWTWLKAHPDRARTALEENRSFIFFRRRPGSGSADGPIGAAGVPLRGGRSLAVDPGRTPYGTPVWIETAGSEALPDGLSRLVVAQDTGAAIVGPARGDLFVGTGAAAGVTAGRLRDPILAWIELRPRRSPRP